MDAVRANRYEKIRLRITLTNLFLSISLPLIFLFSGGSEALRNFAEGLSDSAAVVVLIYLLIVAFAFEIITLPLDAYGGYVVERQFGLARDTLRQWFWDWSKSQALQLVFLIVAIELIYYLLGRCQWMPFSRRCEKPTTPWKTSASAPVSTWNDLFLRSGPTGQFRQSTR